MKLENVCVCIDYCFKMGVEHLGDVGSASTGTRAMCENNQGLGNVDSQYHHRLIFKCIESLYCHHHHLAMISLASGSKYGLELLLFFF